MSNCFECGKNKRDAEPFRLEPEETSGLWGHGGGHYPAICGDCQAKILKRREAARKRRASDNKAFAKLLKEERAAEKTAEVSALPE